MPLQKLSKTDLARHRSGGGYGPYMSFIQGLKVGEGGWTTVAAEKVGRQTIKNRLKKTADHLGVQIKFKRSDADRVVFEVVKAN